MIRERDGDLLRTIEVETLYGEVVIFDAVEEADAPGARITIRYSPEVTLAVWGEAAAHARRLIAERAPEPLPLFERIAA